MSLRNPATTLAVTMSGMLRAHDVTGLLYRIVRDSAHLTGADAGGLLVRAPSGTLELLSATSHATVELELYQAQAQEGPCVDVLRTGEVVEAVGAEEIRRRWPATGAAIVDAGFGSVHAYPLVWRDRVLGGLNLFCRDERHHDQEQSTVAATLADMATLVLLQPDHLGHDDVADRLTRALEGRVVVEQAKGVLAHQLGVDMEAAFTSLVDQAGQTGGSLSATADEVVRSAYEE